MKIDTHQHYWHYSAQDYGWIGDSMPALKRDCLPHDIAPLLQLAGVQAVVAVQARISVAETDFLLSLAAQHPHIVGVVGWADLASPQLATDVERWQQQSAFKGLRHILQDEPDVAAWLANKGHQQGVALLQKNRLVYDVLIYQQHLPLVQAFCRQHDQHWLVLDHAAKPRLQQWGTSTMAEWTQGIRELAQLPHLMCKISGLVTETAWAQQPALQAQDKAHIQMCMDVVLEAFGPQRIMFGSDWPVCQLAAPYEQVHDMAHAWALSRLSLAEQADFWSGNAQRCYQLSLPASSQLVSPSP
ncbi:amidohydrolase family protein [Curvibacter sp. CHRR-16]|uniref:amidohydrolase family protein n=1 Tax=Curvibacter sp. CHRR-16 TaxID=2835872 RepID=UPI001BDA66C5|nr:amidohydrolase family protein [Curvibacter sp. CHRR-16]MBT0570611.1 amidohydrolase family protein [Curvibacter sp. CHRR-16]